MRGIKTERGEKSVLTTSRKLYIDYNFKNGRKKNNLQRCMPLALEGL